MLDNIKAVANNISGPWVLLGDFNEIVSEAGKRGRAPVDQGRCFRFIKWLNECKLINLSAAGLRYIWRGSVQRGFRRVYERLDRVLCNVEWRDLFLGASVFNLPRVKSDHHPILLKIERERSGNKDNLPFLFEFAWTTSEIQ